ncbi:hypothetical protein IAD21_03689 [Abditibacteriota bacterium]|nr:hypothetical protein IAD21_03689 [Abditibacteriota bacterium]
MELFVIAIPAAIYFGTPLLIKFGEGMNANPTLMPVDPAQWPTSVAQTMSRVEHDLYAMGFSIVARFRMSNAANNTDTILTMLVNYKSGDKAMITAIWGNANGVWTLGTHYTEFSTRFEDGHCFDTMNSKTLGSFQRGPMDIKTQVPQLKEAADLWALHRFVMRKHNPAGRKIVYDMKDAETYLRRIWREGFQEQAKFGRFTEKGSRFQPTWKGAYLMTWALMWPMKWIRESQMNTRAQAIIREWRGQPVSTHEGAFDENSVWIKAEAPATT